jgi:putative transposase
MPRQPRLLLSHSYYHIMTRGNNRHAVFVSNSDYIYFLDLLKRFKTDHPFDLFHYCLMPNHVHMLIKIIGNDFSTFMKKLNLTYCYHYKNIYGWTGHFWQDRFKSQPVGKDNYFIQCGKYIELNPVRAGIVAAPGEYLYSSFKHYAEGKKDDLITIDFVYYGLDTTTAERQKSYRDMIITENIKNSYLKNVWGTDKQRYQETRKCKYNMKKRQNCESININK